MTTPQYTITNQVKGYPFEVQIVDNPSITGVALADQVKNLDWRARGIKFVTTVEEAVLEEVFAKFAALLSAS
ncbi:type II toxin-antitoxin system PemK/MazF family toxin [Desulfonatronovibrio magnus]|uniref:type II toxin-antitoxin system PemK/MazF family toxin n=1 Tax=Desulfonatronovibrio magnus TaxID=698827 RepID=UPI000AB0D328|nr:type II toxin-antitoxin system PemK/MazF family toxin [Desulfonatronovibrio magnus]